MSYEEALAKTDPTKCKTVTPASAEEKDAIERFKAFYTDYNQEDRMAKIRHVFAENAYSYSQASRPVIWSDIGIFNDFINVFHQFKHHL